METVNCVQKDVGEERRGGKGRNRPLLLFVVNVDWFFVSHRLPVALAAKDAGFKVVVAAADTGEASKIVAHGLDFVPLPFSRSGTGLFHELRTIKALWDLYRAMQPDVIHQVSSKPVIYGSLVARWAGSLPTINAISGLGYAYTSGARQRGLKHLTTLLYRLALSKDRNTVIFQNPDDVRLFLGLGLVDKHQVVVIRGSGVDCEVFSPTPEPRGVPLVVLASRMLWDKGVGEFIEAARNLVKKQIGVRFALVGGLDEGNPTAIAPEQIQAWQREGIVEWWGHRGNMQDVFAKSNIVVLPSYREGLPKVLIEAAAAGRPIVATDVPGCREVVEDGVNGILVPARRASELADAIELLIKKPALRRQYGLAGREIALSQFSLEYVIDETLLLYNKILQENNYVPSEEQVQSVSQTLKG